MHFPFCFSVEDSLRSSKCSSENVVLRTLPARGGDQPSIAFSIWLFLFASALLVFKINQLYISSFMHFNFVFSLLFFHYIAGSHKGSVNELGQGLAHTVMFIILEIYITMYIFPCSLPEKNFSGNCHGKQSSSLNSTNKSILQNVALYL